MTNGITTSSNGLEFLKHLFSTYNRIVGHSFKRIFKTLRAGGYDQWLTIEAFGTSLPELAATTCVWRELSASPEECYQFGYKTIKEGWDAAA